MPRKLSLGDFKLIEGTTQFNEDFIKSYNEDNDIGYFLEVGFWYLEELHKIHNDFPFLLGRMKIEKVGKLLANLHDKKE